MWDRVFITQNDKLPYVQKTLRDSNGPIDLLTGISAVTFSMTEVNAAVPKITNAAAEIVQSDATTNKGVVRYKWAGVNDTDTPGIYVAEWTVVYGTGEHATFPGPYFAQLYVFIRPQVA